jgi:sRNA-binding regulator protein Hfq
MSSGKMERYSVTVLVNNGRRLLGAFTLTEIPEILLENQMEHVNFWNAVSLILKNLTLPLESLLSASGEINPDSRH